MACLEAIIRPMKTCTLSQAKSGLGKLADRALKGDPTVIPRGGKLVILKSSTTNPDEMKSPLCACSMDGVMCFASSSWESKIRLRLKTRLVADVL